jgi:predicted CoA-binding protein
MAGTMSSERADEGRWHVGMTTKEILQAAKTIAVVGMSTDPAKSAYSVPAALRAAGFRTIPVNPNTEWVGEFTSYPRLEAIPERVDVVEVFRPSDEAASIARSAVAIGAKALWLQIGIESEEARTIAEEGGLAFVQDRCMGVERARHRIRKPRTHRDEAERA